MTDEELIARLRNNPTDEEAALAATRIYNLGLLNDLAEANLEAEELTNWLKLKEAEARVEALSAVLGEILFAVDEKDEQRLAWALQEARNVNE